jgi:hypothetical protein
MRIKISVLTIILDHDQWTHPTTPVSGLGTATLPTVMLIRTLGIHMHPHPHARHRHAPTITMPLSPTLRHLSRALTRALMHVGCRDRILVAIPGWTHVRHRMGRRNLNIDRNNQHHTTPALQIHVPLIRGLSRVPRLPHRSEHTSRIRF